MNRTSSSHSRARQTSHPRAVRSTSFTPSLRRRTTSASIDPEDDPEIANTTHTDHVIVEEIAEIKRYEDFTTIDWVQDAAREQLRRKARRNRQALGRREKGKRSRFRRTVAEAYDAGQAWIVVTLVGAAIGLNAAFLNIVTEWLSDIKLGYCTTAFYLNESFCCWGAEGGCSEWKRWGGAFWPTNYFLYILFAGVFAATAARLVKSFAPYAAGSGISEMKCIIAGFVMKGFLGFTTLFIKSIGLPLAIASGLSVGKEGPSVHYAVCTGNVISRFFDKYRRNAAKTREILSASAAAGVGVAFGSPIGGVLFSLEEMSNYFPLKTLWRSYFCALVATAVLAVSPSISQIHHCRSGDRAVVGTDSYIGNEPFPNRPTRHVPSRLLALLALFRNRLLPAHRHLWRPLRRLRHQMELENAGFPQKIPQRLSHYRSRHFSSAYGGDLLPKYVSENRHDRKHGNPLPGM
jgi:chloride channel 3/4/5